MDYELAKSLMDAGFPQAGKGSFIGSLNKLVWRSGDRVYVPTLEELIEACEKTEGCDHFILEHLQLGWLASIEAQDEQTYSGFHQSTAKEAVARLWLALKKQ